MNKDVSCPKRKNIRLKEYNYAQEGMYFVTICTKNRENILSKIIEKDECRGVHCTSDKTKTGKIVEKYILLINKIYPNICIDEYVIMPNHIHIILKIINKDKIMISKVIQQLKGKITKELEYNVWQKLFYEHIIRNEKEYLKIKEYIINNPINWKKDKYFK